MGEILLRIIGVIAIFGPMFIGAYVGQKASNSVSESSGKFFGVIAGLFIMGVVTYAIYFLLGLLGLATFLDNM